MPGSQDADTGTFKRAKGNEVLGHQLAKPRNKLVDAILNVVPSG